MEADSCVCSTVVKSIEMLLNTLVAVSELF